MINKDDARCEILREWDRWAKLPGNVKRPGSATGMDGMMFFTFLQRKRSDLLGFRASGDKWQDVHGWLLRDRQVKD